jgi:hypothetical protein
MSGIKKLKDLLTPLGMTKAKVMKSARKVQTPKMLKVKIKVKGMVPLGKLMNSF